MKVVAFVPIKLNSERVPLKNIRAFKNGKPLIEYILNTLKEVGGIDKIYVYCSNKDIQKYLPSGVNFLQRDCYYDLSSTPFNEVLSGFAKEVHADTYVLAHATAPFMKKESIETAISKVIDGEYDSALTVTEFKEFVWKNGKPFNYDINNIPRTQDLEPMYIETCGLYVYKKNLIIDENRRIGDKPFLVEISKIEACDINVEEDFIIAEAIFHSITE
jgi:CMP-N-acetylneuraminic acid synthetase